MLSRLQLKKRNNIIHVSVGIVYTTFGILKFFHGASPAEQLAKKTLDALTIGLLPTSWAYLSLAIWETVIGILLLINYKPNLTGVFGICHVIGTFTPLFLFPQLSYQESFSFSLIGQYIIKNIIILSIFISMVRES